MSHQLIHRPPVVDLTYQVFDRPFHPEIIHGLASRTFAKDGYVLRLHLTTAGHVIEWHSGETHLVELLGDGEQEVPSSGQLFAHRVGSERSETASLGPGLSYQTCFQLERMPIEVYLQMDGELRDESRRQGVLHVLSPHDRLGLSPLSYVDLQYRKDSIIVSTFHTYPCDYAVVKSQTLIERSPA